MGKPGENQGYIEGLCHLLSPQVLLVQSNQCLRHQTNRHVRRSSEKPIPVGSFNVKVNVT